MTQPAAAAAGSWPWFRKAAAPDLGLPRIRRGHQEGLVRSIYIRIRPARSAANNKTEFEPAPPGRIPRTRAVPPHVAYRRGLAVRVQYAVDRAMAICIGLRPYAAMLGSRRPTQCDKKPNVYGNRPRGTRARPPPSQVGGVSGNSPGWAGIRMRGARGLPECASLMELHPIGIEGGSCIAIGIDCHCNCEGVTTTVTESNLRRPLLKINA